MALPTNLKFASPLFFHHAFVSYRSADVKAATTLTQALQDVFGLRVWLDLDAGDHDRAPRMPNDVRGKLIAGDDSAIKSALEEAISYSILLVVLSSPRIIDSVWVRKEIVIAEALNKPIFFWHLAEEGEAMEISARGSDGQAPQTSDPTEFLETLAKDYQSRFLATTQSADFMRELLLHGTLNVVGHSIEPYSNVAAVVLEINSLIELCELILSKGESVSTESVQEFWPDYAQLDKRSEELTELIHARYGKEIMVGRVPIAHAFRPKQPFVVQKVAHLERILKDEDYRLAEFQKLEG